MCSFVRYCPIPLHKDSTSFHSNKQCRRGLICLQLCQWSVLLYLKKICQSNRWEAVSWCSFNLHLSSYGWVWTNFSMFKGKLFACVFAHFLLGFWYFFTNFWSIFFVFWGVMTLYLWFNLQIFSLNCSVSLLIYNTELEELTNDLDKRTQW